MYSSIPFKALATCGAIALLSACNSSSSGDKVSSETLELAFVAYATTSDGEQNSAYPLSCDTTLHQLGSAQTDASVADFAFYVHDVRLLTSDGLEVPVTLQEGDWQEQGVALLDFQDRDSGCTGNPKATNKVVLGDYQHSTGTEYSALRFTVGLPEDLNHALPRPSTGILARTDLQWGWAAGYKYLRMDVYPEGGVSRPSDEEWFSNKWNLHLGATSCNTEQDEHGNFIPGTTVCENPYLIDVEIPGFVPGQSQVLIDYPSAVSEANLSEDISGSVGCMSFDNAPFECAPVFKHLGLKYAGVEDHQPLAEQQLFRLKE